MINEDFKNYYKFPLKMWKDFSTKVFTQENNMAFDWLLPWGEKYDGAKKRHLDKINGLPSDVPKMGVTYYHKDGKIIAKIDGRNDLPIALIRGWGMLTGPGGYHLPEEKAAEIQDAFADYCIERLNA
jgi:hypothetical protein